jgi:hypothetical protein
MKKGPLSGEDKEYIKTNYKGLQVTVMAEKLKRSLPIVLKFVDELYSQEPKTPEATDAQNLYARKPERGVVVSTQAASMAADESKEKKDPSKISPRYDKFIHKIKK